MKRYQIRVIPRSSRNQILEISPQELKVKITAPPVEGKANQALIDLLAKHFKVPKSSIRIFLGESSRNKVVEIDD